MDYHSTYRIDEDIPVFTPHLAPSDRAYLAQLRPSQVQRWAVARMHQLNERIASLSSVYNAAAPINRTLPVEILKEVFANLTPSKCSCHRFRVLSICRLWRHLILRTPEYWADANSRWIDYRVSWNFNLARHRFLLDLARGQPLTLNFTAEFDSPFFDSWYGTAVNRISSLYLEVTPSEFQSLGDVLRRGLPALERLGISHKGDYGCRYSHLRVERTQLPRLRSLSCPTQSRILGCADDRFRHLHIYQCACESCGESAHTPPLNDLLKGYLHLHTLTLHYTIPNSVFHYETLPLPSESAPPIALTVLRELTITTTLPIPYPFFSALTLPETCVVHLVCPIWYQAPLRDLIRDPLRSVSQLFNAQELSIYRDQGGFVTFKAGIARSERLQLEFWAASMDVALLKVGEFICRHMQQATTLTIEGQYSHPANAGKSDDVPGSGLGCILAALPSLRHLHIRPADCGSSEYLSSLHEGVPEGEDCLCPHLEELSIVWSFHHDEQKNVREPARTRSDRIVTSVQETGDLTPHRVASHFTMLCDGLESMMKGRSAVGLPLKGIRVGVARDCIDTVELRGEPLRRLGESMQEHLKVPWDDSDVNVFIVE